MLNNVTILGYNIIFNIQLRINNYKERVLEKKKTQLKKKFRYLLIATINLNLINYICFSDLAKIFLIVTL